MLGSGILFSYSCHVTYARRCFGRCLVEPSSEHDATLLLFEWKCRLRIHSMWGTFLNLNSVGVCALLQAMCVLSVYVAAENRGHGRLENR